MKYIVKTNINLFILKEKSQLSFVENFPLSGLATEVLKAAVAPIERVKLLVQNQSETMKQGTLS
jgi:solute carrier family 25 (adenine nucleotide translocator) protein 4/5/6/31